MVIQLNADPVVEVQVDKFLFLDDFDFRHVYTTLIEADYNLFNRKLSLQASLRTAQATADSVARKAVAEGGGKSTEANISARVVADPTVVKLTEESRAAESLARIVSILMELAKIRYARPK